MAGPSAGPGNLKFTDALGFFPLESAAAWLYMDVCVSACLSRGPERTIVQCVDGTSGAGQAARATMGPNASIV